LAFVNLSKNFAQKSTNFNRSAMPKAASIIPRLYAGNKVYRVAAPSYQTAMTYVKLCQKAQRILREEHRADGKHDVGWLGLYSTLALFGVDVNKIVDPFGDNVLKPEQHDVSSDDDDDDTPLVQRYTLAGAKTVTDVLNAGVRDGAVPQRKPAAKRGTKKDPNAAPKPKSSKKKSLSTLRSSAGCAQVIRPTDPMASAKILDKDGNEQDPMTMLELMPNNNQQDEAEQVKQPEKQPENKEKDSDSDSEFAPDLELDF
jgi:hypothetical protein